MLDIEITSPMVVYVHCTVLDIIANLLKFNTLNNLFDLFFQFQQDDFLHYNNLGSVRNSLLLSPGKFIRVQEFNKQPPIPHVITLIMTTN